MIQGCENLFSHLEVAFQPIRFYRYMMGVETSPRAPEEVAIHLSLLNALLERSIGVKRDY